MRFQQTGIFGRGGGALKTAAGFAGVFGFTQMIEDARRANQALTDIAVTGNLTNKEMMDLKKTMREISNDTGKSTAELGRFVATVTTMTGDAKGAAKALSGISEVMVATGASGEALAGTYVKLTTSMGLMPKQAREAFNILRSQEKLGSVTLANVAQQFGKIVGAAGVFGAEAKGLKGVRTLGGLFQISQRAFAVGQEGESANALARFLGNLSRKSGKVKKHFGVDVFDAAGNARDLPTVMEELGTAFMEQRGTFRKHGTMLFGEKGVRFAQRLALEAGRGFDVKDPRMASFRAVVRRAGGTDELGADFRKVSESPAHQFTKQMNLLRNTFKEFSGPIFKDITSALTEWGPTLRKTLKFLLENSKGLLKLWLGYKGITFFKRLMAPVGGGGGGAMALAGAGAAGVPGGGGSVMLPGGQVVPAAAARASGIVPVGGFGQTGGFGRHGQFVKGFGTASVWKSDLQMLREERRWRNRAGNRIKGAGRWVGGMASRYGGGAARFGGQGIGAAGMMGALGQQDMAGTGASMAMMTGNPYAMAIGGAYHGLGAINKKMSKEKIKKEDEALGGLLVKMARFKVNDVFSNAIRSLGMRTAGEKKIDAGIDKYYQTTARGVTEKEEGDRLIGMFGRAYTERGEYDISPEEGAALARRKGSKGLFALQARFGSAREKARVVAMNALRASGHKGKVTEEDLERANPQFAKLNDMWKAIDRLIVQLKKGMPVHLKEKRGSTPAGRLEDNSTPAPTSPTNAK
jgi:hypothetical protein